VGFLRYGAFAGPMIGNTIPMGMEIASGDFSKAGFHAAILAVFVVGVLLSRRMPWARAPIWAALSAMAMLPILCSFVSDRPAASILPLAMGMQNAAASRFNGVTLSAVFVTGALQKIGEGLPAWIWPPDDPGAPKSEGVPIFVGVRLAYAFGAMAGALAERKLTHPLRIAAAVLPFIMVSAGRIPKRRGDRR
jgi:uncharacterized membrane protein YoaK (UPF0700 family)